MRLGVCYYPEQWPQDMWADDAARMAELGISHVRIAEFAWALMEPDPGRYDWAWLDLAIETLAAAGLKIILGTPTATPPKWLVDAHPDILSVGEDGRARGFGSRRHYSFSSETYRAECARIVTAMGERYGHHPAVVAWQIDNEFGCHDTTLSYGADAAARFRRWLATRYASVEALNRAWGTVFWSQIYRSFDEIQPPNLTVTEANPSHCLDYNRFASDEVVSFNRRQVDLLRCLSPGRDIVHNFMGFYTEFDHFAVGRDLDVATWDSYPLGFLEMFGGSNADKLRYLRQGHPDISGFHHDLYRACGRGRWWVMEQQPGPVNWATYNPAPLPGMVRAWTWEAFAHGAELVSYFRWRQAPFAQEQMHAGLNRPDNVLDQGGLEALRVAQELKTLGDLAPCRRSKVALVFSYEADWLTKIQPHGRGFRALFLAFETYSALRRAGLDVDMVAPDGDMAGYRLIMVPTLLVLSDEVVARLAGSGAVVVCGPRTGSRTPEGHIPANLGPGPLQAHLAAKVVRVESLRPGADPKLVLDGQTYDAKLWREDLETCLPSRAIFEDGKPAWVADGRWHYLATWPGPELMDQVVAHTAAQAGLAITTLPEGVRIRDRDNIRFAINFAPEARPAPAPEGVQLLLGTRNLAPGDVVAWRID
ncbi:MAG: beta-galactosidase [Phenylobacterium zucineum]|nr:MAG: beta-galactosidase [Phenylobacterium zucineum]